MNAEVHSLYGSGPVLEPDAEIIGELEKLLAMAKSGALRAFGAFYIDGGNNVETGWFPGSGDRRKIVCGAAALDWRVREWYVIGAIPKDLPPVGEGEGS